MNRGRSIEGLEPAIYERAGPVTLLKERYGENHPKLIQAEATMEELANEVRKAQDTNLDSNTLSIGIRH